MIVALKHGVPEEKKQQLIAWLESLGLKVHVSNGEFQTVLGLVGDTSRVDLDLVSSLDIVDVVRRVSEPFKMCNRKFHPESMTVEVGDVKIGAGHLMRCLTIAEAVRAELRRKQEGAELVEILFLWADEDSASMVRSLGFEADVLHTEARASPICRPSSIS